MYSSKLEQNLQLQFFDHKLGKVSRPGNKASIMLSMHDQTASIESYNISPL